MSMSEPERRVVAVINGLADTIVMLRSALEEAGFATVEAQARDVRNGLVDLSAFVQRHTVDVVLYDIAIPYEDNWRFLNGLQASDELRHTPFVVTTLNQGALQRLVGPTDTIEIIGNPFDLKRVVEAVRRAAESTTPGNTRLAGRSDDGPLSDVPGEANLLDASIVTLTRERAHLAAIIQQAPAFICTFHGPDHVFELANDQYYDLVGRRDIIGKTVRSALPEVAGQSFLELLDSVYHTGESITGSEIAVRLNRHDGPLERRFVNFVYQPLRASDGRATGVLVHGIDVTDLVTAREAIQASESRFRQLADAMPQIVWAATPDGQLDYYNRRWFEYINISPGVNEDTAWDRYIHPEDLPETYATWRVALTTGDPYSVEFRVRGGDDAYRWFLARALPVRDGAESIVRWFGTCTDIHDQKGLRDLNAQLLLSERAMRSQAERASALKDDFLATLSHELRTPLNAILGWARILASNPDREAAQRGIEVIQRNAQMQAKLIEDLLEMSSIMSGKVRLNVQRIALAKVVEDSIASARPAAEAKGIRLVGTIDPHRAGRVLGDPDRLQQVFWNLLTNAIKFTPKGGRVHVALARVDSHVEVSVSDTGQGMLPEVLPHIFERFRQADASTTKAHGGLGLGLSIVKSLVELHGGTVLATSGGLGEGATFTVALPVAPIAQDEASPSGPRVHPSAEWKTVAEEDCERLDGVRILVVDDEPDARELIQRVLEDCGAEVRIAASADAALTTYHEWRPDVLLTDIGMPHEDGYSLIQRVRSLTAEHGGNVPAAALTAFARPEDRKRALRAGFQIHLAKPIDPTELVTVAASLATWRRVR